MASDIYQIDWVFVDTVIIVLLFLLLFGVKIFKSTHRWRSNFSNEAIEYHSFTNANLNFNSQIIRTNHWNLTRNSNLFEKYSQNSVIILLRPRFKKRVIKSLSEGLSSYGFNIISFKAKIKNSSNDEVVKEFNSLITSAITYFKQQGFIINSNYILLNYSTSLRIIKSILPDDKNRGLILINPKIKKSLHVNRMEKFNKSIQHTPVFYIFSKKALFFFKNRNLLRFTEEFCSQYRKNQSLLTLDKAKSSFKYYETILLGILIDIISNKLMKSKVS